MKGRADSSNITRRYEPFRDERGEWSFEIREYQADLNLITPSDVPATPSPSEAYRVVVFLEGYIQEKRAPETGQRMHSMSSTSLRLRQKLKPWQKRSERSQIAVRTSPSHVTREPHRDGSVSVTM